MFVKHLSRGEKEGKKALCSVCSKWQSSNGPAHSEAGPRQAARQQQRGPALPPRLRAKSPSTNDMDWVCS